MSNGKKILVFCIGILFFVVIGMFVAQHRETEKNGIPVLNYHKVDDNEESPLSLSSKEFEEQMRHLQEEGYHSISPDQLIAHLQQGAALPEKPVLITFDDGYRDTYLNAFPIMKKYGFTGTVFLITDEIGRNERYLTWEQAEAMRKSGGFIFGSHTLSHAPLDTLSPEDALFQLVKSKEGMQWKLDIPVKYFAYPTGTYKKETQALVEQAGYKGAFSIQFGKVNEHSNVYALERIPIFKSRWSFYDFYVRLHYTSLFQKIKAVRDAL